jgi:hypothetical protein
MQPDQASDSREAAKHSPLEISILGVTVKQIVLGLAWIVIWIMTLAVSAELVDLYYLRPTEREGFAAMLGMMGVPAGGPLGLLLSSIIARKLRRPWLFLVGAPITGIGTVAFLVIAFTSPLDHLRGEQAVAADRHARDPEWAAIDGMIRSAARAPVEGRSPKDRLLFIVGPDDKKGLIDIQGRIVVEPQFDWALGSSEGRAMVASQDRRGYVDGTGRVVIEPSWAEASPFAGGVAVVLPAVPRPERTFWRDMAFGARAQPPAKYGYIDADGKLAIAAQFVEAKPFSGGVAWVNTGGRWDEDGKWGLIDRTGKFLIEPKFPIEPPGFAEGLCPVWQDAKWSDDESVERCGFVDTHGATVIPPRFRAAGSFADGLAPVVKGGKLGFVDRAGNLVIAPQFEWGPGRRDLRRDWPEFSDGLAPVVLNGKTGFIDKTGRMVIAPQFTRVEDFEDGIARVELKMGQWGYIRRDGSFVWNPQLGAPR